MTELNQNVGLNFLIHLEDDFLKSIARLKDSWIKQGYMRTDSKVVNYDLLTSIMKPYKEELNKILDKERFKVETIKAELEDHHIEIGELCTMLGRTADDYFGRLASYSEDDLYSAVEDAVKMTESLEAEIQDRKQKMADAGRLSKSIYDELQLKSFEEIDENVAPAYYFPILRRAEKLALLKSNHILYFNTAVSWIYHKWTELLASPLEKDDVDNYLTQLFNSTLPEVLKSRPLYNWVPAYPHSVEIRNWHCLITKGDPINISEPCLINLFERSVLDDEYEDGVLRREKLLERLDKLYRIALVDKDQQESVKDPNGKIFIKKLEFEHARILTYIENKKQELFNVHMKNLQNMWHRTHESQVNIDAYTASISMTDKNVDVLEKLVDDYDRQSYQLKYAPDIYAKIRRRKEIYDQLREFEASLSQKGRNRFKGSSVHLLKEERFRKHEYPKLAVLENSLLEPILKFEKEHNSFFMFEGGRFLHILRSSIERRLGNVEIIGLKDAMSTESFTGRAKLPRAQPIPVVTSKTSLSNDKASPVKSSRLAKSRQQIVKTVSSRPATQTSTSKVIKSITPVKSGSNSTASQVKNQIKPVRKSSLTLDKSKLLPTTLEEADDSAPISGNQLSTSGPSTDSISSGGLPSPVSSDSSSIRGPLEPLSSGSKSVSPRSSNGLLKKAMTNGNPPKGPALQKPLNNESSKAIRKSSLTETKNTTLIKPRFSTPSAIRASISTASSHALPQSKTIPTRSTMKSATTRSQSTLNKNSIPAQPPKKLTGISPISKASGSKLATKPISDLKKVDPSPAKTLTRKASSPANLNKGVSSKKTISTRASSKLVN